MQRSDDSVLGAVTGLTAWLGIQADRVWRLGRDCGRLLGGLVRTLRWLLVPYPARPVIGALEGNGVARIGVPSAYLVRVYNPTPAQSGLRVSMRGWRGGEIGHGPSFHVVWNQTLGSGESRTRWVVTTWEDGNGVLVDAIPALASSLWGGPLEPHGRWVLEAALADRGGRVLDSLVIGGELLR